MSTLTDTQRDELRALQDALLDLAFDFRLDFDTPLTRYIIGAPTLRELESKLYPDWRGVMQEKLRKLRAGIA